MLKLIRRWSKKIEILFVSKVKRIITLAMWFLKMRKENNEIYPGLTYLNT